jgi:hypothetical protein
VIQNVASFIDEGSFEKYPKKLHPYGRKIEIVFSPDSSKIKQASYRVKTQL